jgi:hypothetical protein
MKTDSCGVGRAGCGHDATETADSPPARDCRDGADIVEIAGAGRGDGVSTANGSSQPPSGGTIIGSVRAPTATPALPMFFRFHPHPGVKTVSHRWIASPRNESKASSSGSGLHRRDCTVSCFPIPSCGSSRWRAQKRAD